MDALGFVLIVDCCKCVCVSGEDGPSQMGLEDMSMFRALPTATVFYPSDAVSTEKAVELAAITKVRQMTNPRTPTHFQM